MIQSVQTFTSQKKIDYHFHLIKSKAETIVLDVLDSKKKKQGGIQEKCGNSRETAGFRG